MFLQLAQGRMAMKVSVIDPGKLLGFRVMLADAMANGNGPVLKESQLGEKLSDKVGTKEGTKPTGPR